MLNTRMNGEHGQGRAFQADGTVLAKAWRWEAPGTGGAGLQWGSSCRGPAGPEQVSTRQEGLECPAEECGLSPYSGVAGLKFWRD